MATFKFSTVQCKSNKTEAPYLPKYVKKSDLLFTDVCSQVAAEAGLTET